MRSKWQEVKIEELLADKKNAIAMGPFGSRIKTENFVETGIPIIKGKNLTSGWLNEDEFSYLTEEKANELKSSSVERGDLVFTHRGTLGQVGYIHETSKFPFYIVSQSQMKLSVDKTKVNPLFLYYFFKSDIGQHRLLLNTSQTGVPAIARPTNTLKSIKVPLPSLEIQRNILNILLKLDKKININNSIISNLDQLAKTLFKHWFLDFEFLNKNGKPYKSNGGEMVESDLGLLPKGWNVQSMPEICEIIDCLHSKKPTRLNESNDFTLLQVTNILNNGLLDLSDRYYIKEEDYEKWTSKIELLPGDCVLTNVGRVGAPAQIPFYFKGATGRNMTALRVKNKLTSTYLINYLLSSEMRTEINRQTDSGTILESLNVKGIKKLRVITPPEEIIKNTDPIFKSIRDQIEQLHFSNNTLINIRDSILPKILSGEIEILLESEELEHV
ncbi:restriction endonuclease subunit S [Fictibacillus sp. B-59209]|uniref:restriction endonuclease subunit S n=1 Tax=Fictibacillus sp. B-59209 TaxID=3024873 RepID=UPI002E1C15E2|nr:restriction endonuclease subunit S [Fictibacillus sp. B-59209]